MIQLLRRLFGMCQHDWKHQKNVALNEFQETDEDTEIVSSRDFTMWKCTHCKKIRFRKI